MLTSALILVLISAGVFSKGYTGHLDARGLDECQSSRIIFIFPSDPIFHAINFGAKSFRFG